MFRDRRDCGSHEQFVEEALLVIYNVTARNAALIARLIDEQEIIKGQLMTIEEDNLAARQSLDTIIAKVGQDFAALEAQIAALDAANPDPAAVAALQASTAALGLSTAALQNIDTAANPAPAPAPEPAPEPPAA